MADDDELEISNAFKAMASASPKLEPIASLLPVMDPRFNLREIAKQMILLEDHLAQERKRCDDCIRKHFAFIEALAEEGCGLDPQGNYFKLCTDLQEFARRLHAELLLGLTTHEIAASYLRQVRKPLLKMTSSWFVSKWKSSSSPSSSGEQQALGQPE